uniref:Uncharacterized protein n=1 Tax=Arundo donax TaxID=35708 RepID=A0A0A9G891_ARUDO
MDCWLYMSLLHYNHGAFTEHDEDIHACNYWVCDGIVSGEHAWEAACRLSEVMRLDCLHSNENKWNWFNRFVSEYQDKMSRWIPITSTYIQTIPQEATSYFLTLQEPKKALLIELFHQSTKLRVLKLSCCSFSFASPPFLCCHNLRFLWVDKCKDNGSTDGPVEKKGTCFQSLWVLDIRHTNWTWILSPEMMELMTELRELNVKAVRSSEDWNLCTTTPKSNCLHTIVMLMLRIVESSMYLKVLLQDFLMEIGHLELLDLSGNTSMDVLPNLSGASRLKVLILDGCDGLQTVEPTVLPMALESFSFDGFGPASWWKHSVQIPEKQMRPRAATGEAHPRISKISLKGCTRLKNVFLRGLPKLKELNLSKTAVEALDLEYMETKQLEQLFLLGCEYLRSVRWIDMKKPALKLLCVDTREKAISSLDSDDHEGSHSYFGVQKDGSLQHVHVVTTDARFL